MRLFARLFVGLALALATAAGAMVLTAGPAVACSCVQPSADFLDDNDVAFSGVVTSRREWGGDAIFTLRTDRVFKGEISQRVDVVGGRQGDTCAMEAQEGDRLIVFGTLADSEVTSLLCSTVSAPSEAYREILAELGEGTEPSPGYMKAEHRAWGLSYEQFSIGRAVLGVLGLISLAYFAFRAWQARRRTPR